MTDELEPTEDELRRARPAPATSWRHQLLRALRRRPIGPARPDHLWLLVAMAAAAGCALLIVAALLI